MSIKFYSILMPDGVNYYTSGYSVKQVAEKYNVDIDKVKIGADTLHQTHIGFYGSDIDIENENSYDFYYPDEV